MILVVLILFSLALALIGRFFPRFYYHFMQPLILRWDWVIVFVLFVLYAGLLTEPAFAMEADRVREIPDLNLPPEPENPPRAPNAYIEALREDKTLCSTFKTALIKKEQIIEQMTLLLQGQGVAENEIRSGVSLFLSNLMDEESGYRGLPICLKTW